MNGALASIITALVVACIISWLAGDGYAHITATRLVAALVVLGIALAVAQVYFRTQWLRYRREQALSEVAAYVHDSQEFDSAASAALGLIQEVELVSRGYRM